MYTGAKPATRKAAARAGLRTRDVRQDGADIPRRFTAPNKACTEAKLQVLGRLRLYEPTET